MDNSLRGGWDYDRGMARRLNNGMEEVYIKPYVLHNLLIFFMV